MAGAYSYRQLEQLWVSAGGSAALAPIMAAIAMAESGGNPHAFNPSGASGLWQILGAVHPADQSRLFDPNVNAREAVAKYHTQGLGAWVTYTSGAYKKFLQKGASPTPVVTGGQAIVDEAHKFFGTPYVWGGTSPKGFDCSGLIEYVLTKLGMKNVPRTSEQQWAWVQHISKAQLKPGDLVFFAGSDGTATNPGHVAIYAGGGKIIQALETGTNVGLFPMSSAGTPVGYGRIPGINKLSAKGGAGSPFPGPGAGGAGAGGPSLITDVKNFFGTALDVLTGGASGDVANALAAISNNLTQVEGAIAWFFVPSHWVRIFCGIFGTGFVIGGIVNIARTGHSYSVNVPLAGQVPTMSGGQLAPAIGIAEVTIGAVLLFVAFHNLPDNVDSFGAFISHLQEGLQNQGAVTTG